MNFTQFRVFVFLKYLYNTYVVSRRSQYDEYWYSLVSNDNLLIIFEQKCRYLYYLRSFVSTFWFDKRLNNVLSVFLKRQSNVNPFEFIAIIDQKISVADVLWTRKRNYTLDMFINDFDKMCMIKKTEKSIIVDNRPKGIEIAWLRERFEKCGDISDDTPNNAYVITRESCGKIYSNELLFLQKAYYSLVKGDKYAEYRKKIIKADKIFLINAVNRHLTLNYMNSILNIHFFLECFVNSIIYDYKTRYGYTFTSTDPLYTTKEKLKNFPNVMNKNQISLVQFITLWQDYNDAEVLRNSIVHSDTSDKKKTDIYQDIFFWKKNAHKSVNTCVDIALQFWKLVKNNNFSSPEYLDSLCKIKLYKHGIRWYMEDINLVEFQRYILNL